MKYKCLFIFLFIGLGSFLYSDDPDSVIVSPGANSRDTYFTLHHIREAQAISKGKGCKVGILDHSFGMELHPKLYAGGKNFVVDGEEFLGKKEWHGYWMALVLREIAPEVEIYALNTHSFKSKKESAEAIAKAVDWAIEQGVQVLTYSHRAMDGEPRSILDSALERAHRAGIITTFINTGHPGNILPSGLWSGLEDGREPDVNVLHYDYTVIFIEKYQKNRSGENTGYQPFLSVSSTSPVVGGVVAMMKSLRPGLTPAQCQKILRETSYPIEYQGEKAPRALDALAALKRVKEMK